MRYKFVLAIVASAALATAAQASPGTIIAPVAATVDQGGPGFGSINNTFNQNGLSLGYTAGSTNFNAYIAMNPTHSAAFAGNEFYSDIGANSLQVTYDLGASTVIDAFALWNEEFAGIGSFDLLTSLDNVGFTLLTGGLSPINNPEDSAYPAEVFTFGAVSARYVRLAASGCPQPPGNFNACSIGEVAFRTGSLAGPPGGAVPEPASWAMMIAGFGLVGAAMRRRRPAVAA